MGRVWFITGCSTGFGRLLAERLLADDEQVVATARNPKSLERLRDAGGDVLTTALDVTRDEQIHQAVTEALDRFGHIDVLVNNAGYGYFATQEEGDIDEVRRVFETNVIGLVRTTQAILPHMRVRGRGTVINLSSVAGRVAFPRSGFYNATKWAVEALSEALHYEVAPFGLRVVVIEPGAYDTDFGPRSAVRSPQLENPDSPYAGHVRRWTNVLGRMMPVRQDPKEVVEAIIGAANADEPFMRVPLGNDARPLVAERESATDAEFVRRMASRLNAAADSYVQTTDA